jgi:hypothetical protein
VVENAFGNISGLSFATGSLFSSFPFLGDVRDTGDDPVSWLSHWHSWELMSKILAQTLDYLD